MAVSIKHKTVQIMRCAEGFEPIGPRLSQFIIGKKKIRVLYVETVDTDGTSNFITFGRIAASLGGFLKPGEWYNLDYIAMDDVEDEVDQELIMQEFYDKTGELYEPDDIGQYVGILTGASVITHRDRW